MGIRAGRSLAISVVDCDVFTTVKRGFGVHGTGH